MRELFEIKVSARDTLLSISKALYECLSDYKKSPKSENKILPITVTKKVVSLLEKYVKSGSTKYIGRAKVVIPSERFYEYGSVSEITVEIVWSRIDLKEILLTLGVLSGSTEGMFYKIASKSKKYRFFCGARIIGKGFSRPGEPFLKEVNGLSEDGIALWAIIRNIEIDHFGEYCGTCATLHLLYSKRLGVEHDDHARENRKVYENFYKFVIDALDFLRKFRFYGFYSNWEMAHFYSKVEILDVNGFIPAVLSVSRKDNLVIYIISPIKIVKFMAKSTSEYRSLFSGFSSWSKKFLFKNLLTALLVSGRAQVIDNVLNIS